MCRVQVTYSDRKNKHRITLERRYHVNITVLSSIELVLIFSFSIAISNSKALVVLLCVFLSAAEKVKKTCDAHKSYSTGNLAYWTYLVITSQSLLTDDISVSRTAL